MTYDERRVTGPLERGAERIIRGGDCFDNFGGNNYNEAIYWEMS